ncbi:MAG TPA: alkene reductase [Streptosporangiaceae bacterium]|nr:alkene reductase [Streptosporangiaceae bacterium]
MSAPLTAVRPALAAPTPLFSSFSLGQLRLPNRIVMAPLTRARAGEHGVPSGLAAKYYAQRAGAGLIIAEATAVSRQGTGYDNWPGLYTGAQEAGWRTITEAVHAADGRIFVQLFHAGRMSHPVFHHGELPVGPSPVAGGPATELYDGVHPFTQPRALRAAELAGIAAQFRAAAERALAAGFDGVEVHAGNGYLLDQFLRDGANQRDDAYGGNPRNRARLLREVTAAVIDVWGESSVGVRISPLSPTNGMTDSDPAATFTQAARDVASLGVGYLHVIEPGVNGTLSAPASAHSPNLASGFFRPLFPGAIIAAGGHTAATGAARIGQNEADLIAYGQLFIANPDLPARFRLNAPLAQPQQATFYGGGAAGYTDYPPLTPTAGHLSVQVTDTPGRW